MTLATTLLDLRALACLIAMSGLCPVPSFAQVGPAIDMPALAKRAAPGAGQKALQPLAGRWRVVKSIFVATGTPSRPATSENMLTERKWVGGGRYLSDTTTGTIGGRPYFRTGLLGYNSMDKRYEWTTADNQTPILMAYHAANGSGVGSPIDMRGAFTDPGVTGDRNVGKTVPMRTRIRILSNDRHTYELYFTPPGKPEMLADRMVFDRIK